MTETLEVKRLRGSSIFKLILLGNVIGFGLFCALLALPASLGNEILKWNEGYVTGPAALLAGPLIGASIGLLFGLFLAVPVYVGLRVYARFRTLELEYVPVQSR